MYVCVLQSCKVKRQFGYLRIILIHCSYPCTDSFVENVIASDCDTGDNSNITYTIIGGDQTFRIVNGVIQVNGILDYEQDQQFIFTVEARDNGVPSLSSSAEVCRYVCVHAQLCGVLPCNYVRTSM